MANTEEIQGVKAEIEQDLIEAYGNTIVIRSPGTVTYDEWGEPVPASQVDVTTIGVTDQYTIAQMRLTQFGRLQEGQSIVIIKADESVDENYTLLLDSVEYNVISIEKLQAADVVVALVLTVASK